MGGSRTGKLHDRESELDKIDAYGRARLLAFRESTTRANSLNQAKLDEILSQNASTVFGLNNHFVKILASANLEESFREFIPVSEYSDYLEYIERIASGETSVLCSDTIESFAGTAGTTGARKFIPKTRRARQLSAEYMGVVHRAMLEEQVEGYNCFALAINLMSFYDPGRTYGKLKFGSATNAGLKGFADYISLFWTSPPAAFDLPNMQDSLYLHALFGLAEENIDHITAIFAAQVTSWVDLVIERKDDLVADIANSTVSIDLPKKHLAALEGWLDKRPERAARVAKILDEAAERKNRQGLLLKLWPQLSHISANVSGSFSVARPQLEFLTRSDFPIITVAYVASECMIGVQLDPYEEAFVLAVGAAYFEFLPENAQLDSDCVVNIDALNVGKKYELILTTPDGLYRYRLGDVVEIVGFYNEAPVFKFSYRPGLAINLVGEKSHENHIRSATHEALSAAGIEIARIGNFVAAGSTQEGFHKYMLHLEIDDPDSIDQKKRNELQFRFDAALQSANPCYRDLGRKTGVLKIPEIVFYPLGKLQKKTVDGCETDSNRKWALIAG